MDTAGSQPTSAKAVDAVSRPAVTVLQSAAALALLTTLRSTSTGIGAFQRAADALCDVLAAEGLAPLGCDVTVSTPCGTSAGRRGPAPEDVCAVSIVRSGDILCEAVRRALVGCSVAKILVQRDEADAEKRSRVLYAKLPADIAQKQVVLCDPMLATGGSAINAIKVLVSNDVPEESILFLNVVACPEGLEAVAKAFPAVRVTTVCVDQGLNGDCYIVPGLGDFGDRYYGTAAPAAAPAPAPSP